MFSSSDEPPEEEPPEDDDPSDVRATCHPCDGKSSGRHVPSDVTSIVLIFGASAVTPDNAEKDTDSIAAAENKNFFILFHTKNLLTYTNVPYLALRHQILTAQIHADS